MSTTEEDLGHLEEVRARLEARGLLRAGTATGSAASFRLPEIASPTIVLPDAGDGRVASEAIVVAGAPVVAVACPSCSTSRHVGINRTGFECGSCQEAWRWAICRDCDRLALTSERQESWRCRACDGLMRSWWKTSLPTDEPTRVIRRRTEQFASHAATAVVHEQRSAWRRTLVRMGAVALVLVLAAAAFSVLRAAGGVESGAPCGQFDRLVGQIQTGALQGDAARTELRSLADATGNRADLRAAATAMAAAPSVMSTEFAVARTRFQDQCRGS